MNRLIFRSLMSIGLMLALWLIPGRSHAGLVVDVEAGLAASGYNDVRIPGNTGTEFSLTDDFTSENSEYYRIRFEYSLGQNSRLSLLVAPLRIDGAGTITRTIDFNGVRFEPGDRLVTRYRFDSYRLSYQYAVLHTDRVRFDLGLTAKIRDAAIMLRSPEQIAEKTNTGFVPLIHFALDWSLSERYGLLVRGDALAAPQGRAEDVQGALYRQFSENIRFRLGYRILEGGADNDKVYNFALVHYLSAGISASF